MQTFLPYPSFAASASTLHMKHLGKQRVENLQIMHALTNPNYGWQNHPAKTMWEGYEAALYMYQEAICNEWTQVRGYKDTCLDKTWALLPDYAKEQCLSGQVDYPSWLGNVDLHLAYQSKLVQKKPEHYGEYFPDVPTDLEYVWPTKSLV